MKNKLLITTALVSTFAGTATTQADTPIQLSLTPQIALYPRDTMVRGFALNIWGENPQLGLNIGIINGSTEESGGFSLGLVNYAESYTGVQFGAVNISTENFVGWQHGYFNISQGTFEGFQLGLVNLSEQTTGFQLGAINYAQNLHGLQIGFVNIAPNNSWFDDFPNELAKGFPVLNWSF